MDTEVVLVTFITLVTCYISFQPFRNLLHSASSRLWEYTRKPKTTSTYLSSSRPEKDSHVEPLLEMQRGLSMLKEAGMRKINFAGGEPLLYPKLLSELVEFCKTTLHLESVSIVTNGSKLDERFLKRSARYINIIAVSCDSFNEEVNVQIGRGKGEHLAQVRKVSQLCKDYGIKFKLNTVINRYNFNEDMNDGVIQIDPFRWKCFQVLLVQGENDSTDTLRDASPFAITDEEYQVFCDTHSHNRAFVAESNKVMRSSYLILDEYMRFLNKGTGDPTKSILKVGVQKAMEKVDWDTDSFHQRGGIYDWSKEKGGVCGTERKELDW